MIRHLPHVRQQTRRCALGACIAAALSIPSPAAIADTHPVSNCSDSGAGSLRSVVGASTTQSGDTIDLTSLNCSVISLDTGIAIALDELTIDGPGEQSLTITRSSGSVKYRIFRQHGYYGSLHLNNMTGAIFATNLTTHHSLISGNALSISDTTYPNTAQGGGVFVERILTMTDTTVKDNSILAGALGRGGGIFSIYQSTIVSSTISGNHVGGIGGGAVFTLPKLIASASSIHATITNSTIPETTLPSLAAASIPTPP